MEEEIVAGWDAHALSREVGPGPALAHRPLSGNSNDSLHWPLGSKMIVTDHAHPCRQCPAAYEHTEKEPTMASPPPSSYSPEQWSLASLIGPGFFPDSLICGTLHLAPMGYLHTVNPSPSTGSDL